MIIRAFQRWQQTDQEGQLFHGWIIVIHHRISMSNESIQAAAFFGHQVEISLRTTKLSSRSLETRAVRWCVGELQCLVCMTIIAFNELVRTEQSGGQSRRQRIGLPGRS